MFVGGKTASDRSKFWARRLYLLVPLLREFPALSLCIPVPKLADASSNAYFNGSEPFFVAYDFMRAMQKIRKRSAIRTVLMESIVVVEF